MYYYYNKSIANMPVQAFMTASKVYISNKLEKSVVFLTIRSSRLLKFDIKINEFMKNFKIS